MPCYSFIVPCAAGGGSAPLVSASARLIDAGSVTRACSTISPSRHNFNTRQLESDKVSSSNGVKRYVSVGISY
ncbi:hypothetical protein BO94DRAFT_533817 [Aspergillus sclerotioniger CBS 115572]|uniref:Uncharacterized protein n=1 Tax=Aspergillus sclerotioniger CBS 115572 TaxID=1450535 RepID=A0A317X199_9EURO|nr:hypothetical protein BO94DRAFT_533817 [Aspergillus sclerotioniger CBS 115572]PWY90310.1 hypothetical protein BO94DRAFT_533817 [Aspergillus sclerotioniger CBS 115572]